MSRATVALRSDLGLPCMEVMNFLNEATDRYRHAISFAAGRPPDRFVSAERAGHLAALFVAERARSSGEPEESVWRQLGQYGPTNGMISGELCRFLARDEGLTVDPAGLMVTNGMQEALFLLLAGVCERGRDLVLCDDPTYVGLVGAATLAGVPVLPLAGPGPILDRTRRALEAAGERRARALYVIPDFSNPSGQTLTLAERRGLLQLAARAQLLVVEDTAYRAFRYDGEPLPCLKALDQDGVVVQVGSFSKLFQPGPRLGYLLADQRAELAGVDTRRTLAEELSRAKSFVSVLTSPLTQAVVGGFLVEQDFSLTAWNGPRIAFCRANRDALLEALETDLGADPDLAARVNWTRPQGGFFLTLTLPFPFGTDQLMTCARDHGVIVSPMSYFSADPGLAGTVRLSFSNVTPEQARAGVGRLHRFVRDEMVRRAC